MDTVETRAIGSQRNHPRAAQETDFWGRMVGFVAVPVLSLLAAQFPELNHFLFSWLEPALQSIH